MTTPFGDLFSPPRPFILHFLLRDRQFARRAAHRAVPVRGRTIMMSERQHVRRSIEEIVALA